VLFSAKYGKTIGHLYSNVSKFLFRQGITRFWHGKKVVCAWMREFRFLE